MVSNVFPLTCAVACDNINIWKSLKRYSDADKIQHIMWFSLSAFAGSFFTLRCFFMTFKAKILSSLDIDRILIRIAHQICEKNSGIDKLCLIGIRTRGVPLAQRLAQYIERIEGRAPEVGALDITLHRDDRSKEGESPVVSSTDVPFSVEGKTVVLVDDVIYTCRTARAALDAVMTLGRPARIQLSVLIDRGHSELPIRANFVGKNIPTSQEEIIAVRLRECDDEDSVSIYGK